MIKTNFENLTLEDILGRANQEADKIHAENEALEKDFPEFVDGDADIPEPASKKDVKKHEEEDEDFMNSIERQMEEGLLEIYGGGLPDLDTSIE